MSAQCVDPITTRDTTASAANARPHFSGTLRMATPETEHTVILVHGTFAADDREEGTRRWWQRGSSFVQSLKRQIKSETDPKLTCAPPGEAQFYSPPWWKRLWRKYTAKHRPTARSLPALDGVFHWSGENRESARRQAAALLLDHLNYFNSQGPFHVIAHSHGGAVLWEALSLAAASANPSTPTEPTSEQSPSAPTPLRNLQSCTTVATPFLHYAADVWSVTALLPLVLLIVAFCYEGPWFWDTWNQLFFSLPWSPFTKFAGFLWLYAAALLSVSLLARLAWSCYYYESVIQENPDLVPEVRQHQRDDIVSSILALLPG